MISLIDYHMPIHICLLRGINVGGNDKIHMADLKAVYESVGESNDVCSERPRRFDAASTDAPALITRIEIAIQNASLFVWLSFYFWW